MNATVIARASTAHQKPPTAAQVAITDSSWPRLIASFVDQLNADAGGIVVQYLNKAEGRVLYGVNLPEDGTWGYDEQANVDRSWLQAVRQLQVPGAVRQWRLPADGTVSGPLFKYFLQPRELRHIVVAALARRAETIVFLVLFRRDTRQPFKSQELQVLRAMMPVLTSTWELNRMARRYAAVTTSAWGVLDFLALGVVVVNRDGDVFQMNSRARDLIARGDKLTLRQGRLSCPSYQDNQRLRTVLMTHADGAPNPKRALSIAGSDDHAPLRVMLAPLSAGDWRHGHGEPLLALFLSDPAGQASPNEQWLRELYRLTRMEARVAVLLCLGHHPREIAERLRISVHTVRRYMTDIFSKAGVSRQTDLLRQLMVFSGSVTSDQDMSPA